MGPEHDDFTFAVLKVFILWAITLIAHNYDSVAHAVLVTLSIAYLVWKWRRDYIKNKKA